MLRKIAPILGIALAAAATATSAQAATTRPLVYVVVIDALDGDRVDEGKAPFISSLLRGEGARATYYRESRAVMVSETNPNHVAMMTGAYAGQSGVYSNAFAVYRPLPDDDSCRGTGPENLAARPTETSGESADCLDAETVFTAIRRQGNPDGLVTAGIFGKPKLGRLFSGAQLDSRRDLDYLWAPCHDDPGDESYCESVPTVPRFGYTYLDSQVMDVVLRTIRDGAPVGGARRRPDLTFVSMPEVDNAGHVNGTATGVYDAAIGDADEQVRRLVAELRARGEWDRSVLILASDHSMATTLTKTSMDDAYPAAGIPRSDFVVVGKSSADLVYLADRVAADRFAKLKRMREVALAQPNVLEALYREPNPLDGGAVHTIDAVHPQWRASGPRGPDLLLIHRPGGSFSDPDPDDQPLPGHHGAPDTRDNFFAVIGGDDGIAQLDLQGRRAPDFDDTAANPGQAENVDVAATVMGLFGLQAPRDNAGRFLGEAFDGRRLPGYTAPNPPELRIERLRSARPPRSGRARGSVRARAMTPLYRYRASWSPGGGVYDLAINLGGRPRLRVGSTQRTSLVFTRPKGRTLRIYLRARSASGARSRATRATVGPLSRRGARRPGG